MDIGPPVHLPQATCQEDHCERILTDGTARDGCDAAGCRSVADSAHIVCSHPARCGASGREFGGLGLLQFRHEHSIKSTNIFVLDKHTEDDYARHLQRLGRSNVSIGRITGLCFSS
jgi:hypothetical protein